MNPFVTRGAPPLLVLHVEQPWTESLSSCSKSWHNGALVVLFSVLAAVSHGTAPQRQSPARTGHGAAASAATTEGLGKVYVGLARKTVWRACGQLSAATGARRAYFIVLTVVRPFVAAALSGSAGLVGFLFWLLLTPHLRRFQ